MGYEAFAVTSVFVAHPHWDEQFNRLSNQFLAKIAELMLNFELSPTFGDGRAGQAAAVTGCRRDPPDMLGRIYTRRSD
jgi:hypothetical protein